MITVTVTYKITDVAAAELSPTGEAEDFEIGEDSQGMLDEVALNLAAHVDIDVRFD